MWGRNAAVESVEDCQGRGRIPVTCYGGKADVIAKDTFNPSARNTAFLRALRLQDPGNLAKTHDQLRSSFITIRDSCKRYQSRP